MTRVFPGCRTPPSHSHPQSRSPFPQAALLVDFLRLRMFGYVCCAVRTAPFPKAIRFTTPSPSLCACAVSAKWVKPVAQEATADDIA